MLSPEQVLKLISSNESLQAQLDELNDLLGIREEEIALLKKKVAAGVELRSRLDRQLEELEVMEGLLGKKERQATGAEEREIGLHQELTQAAREQQAHQALATAFRHLQTRYNDLEYELGGYKENYRQLEAKAHRAAELQSLLEDAQEQNGVLKARLQEMELQLLTYRTGR